jgi:type II secretory pathway pseudopilin PulG
MSSGRREQGFTYLALMIAVAVIGAGLAAAGTLWSQARQREKEAELLFIGAQFRQAIARYYQRTPGAAPRYPAKLEDLLLDRRYPSVERHLRRIYADPMTGKAQWGLIEAPEGGIMGVRSLSEQAPIKTANFRPADRELEGKSRYSEWKFTWQPLPPPPAPPSR